MTGKPQALGLRLGGAIGALAAAVLSLASPSAAQIESSTLAPPTANATTGPARVALPPPRGTRGVTLLPNGAAARQAERVLPNGQGAREPVSILEGAPGEGLGAGLLEDRTERSSIILLPSDEGSDLLEGDDDATITLLPEDDDAPTPGTETPTGNLERFKIAPFKTPAFRERDRTIRMGATEGTERAELRVLDMITGETETIEVATRQEVEYGRLSITLVDCERPSAAGRVGDLGLIEIQDSAAQDDAPVFSGWMFAESPALSAMDHPRYDVWLISCIASSPEQEEGSAQKSAGLPNASSSNAR